MTNPAITTEATEIHYCVIDRDSGERYSTTSSTSRSRTMTTHIPNGTLVTLDDGSTATAHLDADGTYRTAQVNPVTGGTRVDLGWRREQLTVVETVKFAIFKSVLGTAGREQVGEECHERKAEERVKHLRKLPGNWRPDGSVYYWYEPVVETGGAA